MARTKSSFSFSSTLSSIKGGLIITVVFIPDKVVKALPKGRIRTKGTINGVPFSLAPLHRKDGSRFFSVSASLRRAAKIKVGDTVKIAFKLVDPSVVDIPEELQAVLEQDDKAMEVWNSFIAGLQRSLIHYVTSVKSVDSRINRSLQLMEKAKAGLLSVQKPHP